MKKQKHYWWWDKMGSYQDWLEAVYDEMNELYTMELGEAVRNVNRRLRGEE